MADGSGPLAVVTGASSGIGHELAHQCAASGFDLAIAADEPRIEGAAAKAFLDSFSFALWNELKDSEITDVAEAGFKAMMNGDGDVVTGWQNKLQSAIADITPAAALAERHRRMAEPQSR
jgi:short-subunit dehydrogenase